MNSLGVLFPGKSTFHSELSLWPDIFFNYQGKSYTTEKFSNLSNQSDIWQPHDTWAQLKVFPFTLNVYPVFGRAMVFTVKINS